MIARAAATVAKQAPEPLESVRAAIRTKQFEHAVGELRQQADRGSSDAQYLLGLALFNGLSREPDREQGCRWLRTAAEHGHVEAQFVLASILFTDGSKNAAEANLWLERAARGGNVMAQRAIQEKRRPVAAERKSVLADSKLRIELLLWAAQHNDAALTRQLMSGAGIDSADEFGTTALSEAAGAGASDSLAVLLEARARVDSPDHFGTTPLMRAAAQSEVKATAALLAHGANPKSSDSTGNTALMYAARKNRAEQVGRARRCRRRDSSSQFAGLVGTRRGVAQRCRSSSGRTT